MAKKTPPTGTTVWLIRTSSGYLDRCLYKTLTALAQDRNYFWSTEHGARTAYAGIQNRFPKLGPIYELWQGIIIESTGGYRYAVPIQLLEAKDISKP